MKVYLAGPMRGHSSWNFPTFKQAKECWERAGHHVFCPATIAAALGYGPDHGVNAEPGEYGADSHLRHVLLGDVLCLSHADAIALLPGWETSRGAAMELATAQFLGLPIFCATTMERMYPIIKPWQEVSKLRADIMRSASYQGVGHIS